ncbi:hypothetical protein H6F67_08745 [Microcoleus sp. FACHB-1515]|uniref:hypothetical protein n=1 Tax=Cyanophyceae TaxID=3028117 RepID=UPI001681C476|nr:hypothetical protein [Microcoleus sp. FACHB-1515]MBD2089940.1 hypothetical protein [Microcoleus sp. FACHB-1515]
MGEWGIENYQPRWTNSASKLADLLAATPIVGLQAKSVWVLWDSKQNQWFNDAPVVVCTSSNQLEFCAKTLNSFSFSVNSIDLTSPVYWCGSEELGFAPLQWIQEAYFQTQRLKGKQIAAIRIVEECLDKNIQIGLGYEQWAIAGVELRFESDRLQILNGLDCNQLFWNKKLFPEMRYFDITY